MNLFEPIQRVALRRGRHPAIIWQDKTLTYAALLSAIERIAGALHEKGVRAGDVVAVQAYTLATHVPLALGIARLGAVSLPFTVTGHVWAPEIASMCRARFLVHGGDDARDFGIRGLAGQFTMEELGRSHAVAPPVADVPGDSPWRIALSSGTTGRPKAIPCSHESQLLKGAIFRALVASPADERMLVGMGPAVMFAANFWLRALLAGRTLVGSEAHPAAMFDAVHRHGVTHFVTSPGNAIAMMDFARSRGSAALKPAAAMRALVLGGSAVSSAQLQRFKERLAPNVFVVYGATEVGVVALSDTATQEADPGCAGAIPPWVEVQALAQDGSVLPVGKAGRLRMRVPGMASSYLLPDDDPSSQAFRDGWFHSSDIGCVTPEGTVRLRGRDDDVINLAGVKVDPADVEAVLARDAAIVECAVFAIALGAGSPQLAAAIVAAGEIDGAALRDRCLREIGPAGAPHFVFRVAALPRNEAGKLVRGQLLDCVRDAQQI